MTGRFVLVAGLAALIAPPVPAQGIAPLEAAGFVRIVGGDAVNLRAGPSTGQARRTRLAQGTVLRRISCVAAADADTGWCEVETRDGSVEGWVAARFLAPVAGADPDALRAVAVAADTRLRAQGPGRYTGTLAPGAITDLLLTVEDGAVLSVSAILADGLGTMVFGRDGAPLVDGLARDVEIVFVDGGEIAIRVADMQGAGGDWSLTVTLE